jgi:geranylgeranyl pyrophosphate synthase
MSTSVASDGSGRGVDPEQTPFEAVLNAGGAGIRAAMADVEQELARRSASHGATLTRLAGDTLAAGGKRLRPLLVFVCAGPAGVGAASEALVRAGAAVELVHMATLVHDDIVDEALVRRGRPTVYAERGAPAATATGDYLFATAFTLLRESNDQEQVRVLTAACVSLARGELAQREDAYSGSVSVERYLERCELKTASLFAAACSLGTLAAGHDGAQSQTLAKFGRDVGLAFQLLDDVLDVVGMPERTGKERGGDLLEGTVTMPLLLAAREDEELAELDLRSIRDRREAKRICDRIAATSGVAETRRRAAQLVAGATAKLDGQIDAERASLLRLVADRIVNRYS